MTFRVGQKVCCVDVRTPDPDRGAVAHHLEEGVVYTIRWVGEFSYEPDRTDGAAVRLVEVFRESDDAQWVDYPFKASRFRPLVSRKTDISALKALLVPGAKIRETA